MTLLARLEAWGAAALAFILAIAGVFLYGRSKGKAAVTTEVVKDQAQQAVNTAQAKQERTETRKVVEDAVAKLPQSPVLKPTVPAPLPVPGSSADRLRNEWSRD